MWTMKMIARVESLIADYRAIVLASVNPDDTVFEFGQIRRLNEVLSYLEERAIR